MKRKCMVLAGALCMVILAAGCNMVQSDDSSEITVSFPASIFMSTGQNVTASVYTLSATLTNMSTNAVIAERTGTIAEGSSYDLQFGSVPVGTRIYFSVTIMKQDGTVYMSGNSDKAGYVVQEGTQSISITLYKASGESTTGTGVITGVASYANAKDSSGIIVYAVKQGASQSAAAASDTAAARAATVSSITIAATDAVARASADGSFSFKGLAAGATYSVCAVSPVSAEMAALKTVTIASTGASDAITLTLTETGTITGTVQLNGKDAGNGGLVVYIPGTNYLAVTNDGGTFSIAGVPASDTPYSLSVLYGGAAYPYTVSDAAAAITVTGSGSFAAGTMTLVPVVTTGAITGSVTLNGSSANAAYAAVYLGGTGYSTVAEADGSFTFAAVPAGTYTVVACKDNASATLTEVVVTAGKTTAAGTLAVSTLTYVKHAVAEEAGVRFTVLLPSCLSVSSTNANQGTTTNSYSIGNALVIKNVTNGDEYSVDVSALGNIVTLLYPFVKKDSTYTFEVYCTSKGDSDYHIFDETLSVTAIGGWGDLTLSNTDGVGLALGTDGTISVQNAPAFTDFGHAYTSSLLYIFARGASWDESGCLWLYNFDRHPADSRYTSFSLFNSDSYFEDNSYIWRDASYIKPRVIGRTCLVDLNEELTIAGFTGTFNKWVCEKTATLAGDPVTVTVSFDANGGTNAPAPVTVGYGMYVSSPISEPTAPAATDGGAYVFTGWYTDKDLTNLVNFDSAVDPTYDGTSSTLAVTLYAGWKKYYTVSYSLNGGSFISESNTSSFVSSTYYSYSAASGTAFKTIANPVKSGCTFGGWYSDEAFTTPITSESTITGNTTLYAKWTESTIATGD